MKNLIIFLAIFYAIQCFSQVKTNTLKVVPLVENRTYELDGGIIVLSTSRVIIPIELPANTIEWYYVFTSYSDQDVVEEKTDEINLVSDLSYVIDRTGTTATALSALLTPSGSSASNVYLFDRTNALNFVNKTDQDLFPTYWGYYSDYSIKSAKQGKQKINLNSQERFYLGIQAGSSPVVVKIEIVAIVDESVTDYSVWSETTIKEVKDAIRGAFVDEEMKEREAITLSNCIVDSLVADYSPEVFFNLKDDEKTSVLEEYAEKCIGKIDGLEQTAEQKKAVTYGNLGWEYYESGNIDKAIEYSNKALQLQNDLGYVKANLALFYFIQGDESKGNDLYVDAIMDLKNNKLTGQDSLKAAIEDIENAAKKYTTMTGYELILKELKREYQEW